MANYSTLKAAVADVVKTNGTQAITGANLQAVLLSIINSVGGGGYIFKGVATPNTDAGTPDENVFYIGGAGTYANFGTSVVVPPTNIAVFKYNGTWNCEQLTVENGGVFDISAFKATGGTLATYADLAAALGTNGANVPEGVRKGGMSVKFVCSYDNKYVQYRLMSDTFNTTSANWQSLNADDKPTSLSNNLVKSSGVVNYVAPNTGLPLIEEQILHQNDILYEGENVPIGRKMLFDFAIGYITLYKGNVVDRYIGSSSEATVTEYTIPSTVTRIIVGSSELNVNQIRFLDIRTNKELGQDIEETNIYVGFKKVVLNGIGVSGVGFFTKVGDCYYNTTLNKIARCLTYTDTTHFTQEYNEPQESVIYIVGGILYTYNGTTLVSYTPARQEYYHKQFDSAINDIKPYTIPACDELPITEITVNTNNGYTAANGEIVAAPLSYEDLLKEFYDKYIGYFEDGYCVTKTEIGRTIDSGHTYPLYEFDFIPKRYNKIVMISAGMNAQELTTIFGLAFFIKNIMENHESDAGLKYLYENVRFKIVPIINVWGYNQTDLQYKNANGVSINNNWDYNNSWSDDTHTNPSSSHYKGDSPFSEEETKILKRWLTINGRSAELWIDCHSGVGVQSDVANLKTFYTFASPVSLLYEIKNCQQKIISFYQSKGYSPTPAMCGIGMSYPKTEDAFRTYGVKAIMIEQYPNAPGYGGSGETDQTLQNKDVDITNYVLMLRAYTLIALKNKAYQFDNNDIAYMLYQWKLNNIGRDNINAKFPLYTFYHGEITESYTRRGTDKIPVTGGSDTVFIVPISDVEIVECRFYTANSSTAVSKGQDGNIIYTTLSGQQYFRTTFKRGLLDSLTNVDEGMDYYGIDRTMVEIEINGECYNYHYDFTHHSFNSNKEVVLNTTRDRVMSPYFDVTGGDYIFIIDDDFVLVDLVAFNQYRNYPVRIIPNGNVISIPSDKTLLRATFRRTDGSVINLIDTDRIIKEFFKIS